MDFIRAWSARTGITQTVLVVWLGVHLSKYYDWRQRYGKVNTHNGQVPRDFWLEPWEREAIVTFHDAFPLEGYRRLTFMMLDQDVVAVSPSTTYRVLRAAGRLGRRGSASTTKGRGFVQSTRPHQHWHVDIAYLNICSTFYYICSILDGYSRAIVQWEIREAMTEADVEIILQRARERFPSEHPRIISDNGPQLIARDFKTFIRESGMEHVRTSPYYPQSNGKKEGYWRTLKGAAAADPALGGRRAPGGGGVCGALQYGTAAFGHWLRYSSRQDGGSGRPDSRRAGSQTGSGPRLR